MKNIFYVLFIAALAFAFVIALYPNSSKDDLYTAIILFMFSFQSLVIALLYSVKEQRDIYRKEISHLTAKNFELQTHIEKLKSSK